MRQFRLNKNFVDLILFLLSNQSGLNEESRKCQKVSPDLLQM